MKIIFAILVSFLPCIVIASTTQSSWKETFSLGYGNLTTHQTQTVHLADTPAPGLDNRYVGSSKFTGAILMGLAFEKEFDALFKDTKAAAGFEINYLGNKSIDGTVEPMINVSPDFDVLNYYYDIDSYVFQATAKYVRQEYIRNFGLYIQGGLGAAINRLSDYFEYAPGDSTAAPMLYPFGNRTTVSPAVSAGIGVTYKIGHSDKYVSFGYRYFYTGRAKLTKSPGQQTNSAIKLSSINYQFLVLSVTL